MMPTHKGSIRLFRAFGIDVFVHWSWFVAAMWILERQKQTYVNPIFSLGEYLGLFAIVLMHEFGHSLACRQVGGTSDQIVLWPLGGVAYVAPPARAGAELWSIAAGPLVNVALLPVFYLLASFAFKAGWPVTAPDTFQLIASLMWINTSLLIFNILPVYPLDGGQILRSLLWYPLGRVRSLQVATIIGFIGVGAFGIYALKQGSTWYVVMAAFLGMNCKRGWDHAKALSRAAAIPRRADRQCPECSANPPEGAYWLCGKCNNRFDTFAHRGSCPTCGTGYSAAQCLDCGAWSAREEWKPRAAVPVEP